MRSKNPPAKTSRGLPRVGTPKRKPIVSGSSVSFDLSVESEGLEPILGAAYLLTDRAYAALDGDCGKKLRVTLRPKAPVGAEGLNELGDLFLRELETQKVRWAIARNNLPVREYIAEQAVLLANGSLPAPEACAPPAGDQLTDEQRSEIDKLIAEVEEEIKAMNQKKAVADPKNIKASWEEKQEQKPHAGSGL